MSPFQKLYCFSPWAYMFISRVSAHSKTPPPPPPPPFFPLSLSCYAVPLNWQQWSDLWPMVNNTNTSNSNRSNFLYVGLKWTLHGNSEQNKNCGRRNKAGWEDLITELAHPTARVIHTIDTYTRNHNTHLTPNSVTQSNIKTHSLKQLKVWTAVDWNHLTP